MIEKVTTCMQTSVLGDSENGRLGQWKFPLKDGSKQVEARSMANMNSRKCVMGLKTIASLVFAAELDEHSENPEETRRENKLLEKKWHEVFDTYLPMMTCVRKHEDFTDEEIDEFHVLTSRFMSLWVDLTGGKGITNYIHLIGAGHITYYLRKHRNLNKFCQQGWEALNQLLKQFYFNNTNHGGSLGNSNGDMIKGEHCKPLIRLCQRRTMWLLGLGDTFFEDEDVIEEMEEAEEADNPNVI